MKRRIFIRNLAALSYIPIPHINALASTDHVSLNVKVFPGAQNLPLWVGLEKMFFTNAGLNLNVAYTANSDELRSDLANGKIDIAHAAVDNSVAIQQMTGKPSIILMGGDSSMNQLIVQPEIKTADDMRGKILIVDAPNTAYALQAMKALSLAGVKPGEYSLKVIGGTGIRFKAMQSNKEYSASTLNPPFSVQALDLKMNSLGWLVDLVGPYQASGMFAMKPFIDANGQTIEKYIAAWIRSLRWALDQNHKEEVLSLLQKRLNLDLATIEKSYAILTNPRIGLAIDAQFSMPGFQNLLEIRQEFEKTAPLSPNQFFDLSHYKSALASLTK